MTAMQKHYARLEVRYQRISDELQYEWDNGGDLETTIHIANTVTGTCGCGNHILEMDDSLEFCNNCQIVIEEGLTDVNLEALF